MQVKKAAAESFQPLPVFLSQPQNSAEVALVVLMSLLKVLEKSIGDNSEESSNLDMFSLEMFENIAFVMAKHADASIPNTPEEWLDGFNTFSIYQLLPQLIELWGLNVQTDVEAKKNFVRQTVK